MHNSVERKISIINKQIMKKVFTLIIALIAITTVKAQNEGTFEESYTSTINVLVGGMYSYNAENVTYKIHRYTDGGTEKLDVVIPAYNLKNTAIGDLEIGSYTVYGVEYDNTKSAYYRDYSNDGCIMHFKGAAFDKDYETKGNIEIKYGTGDITITNNFAPGSMPFSLVSTFNATVAGINEIESGELNVENSRCYNLSGQRIGNNAKGIIIRNGKKFINK